MRKLASVQIIKSLDPIPDADRIEVATIEGWKVVVQKGLHEVGDRVVYCEIDSVLDKELFPEVEKFGCRIRTIKLRGQVSQGYAIPLADAIKAAEKNGWALRTDTHGSILHVFLSKKFDQHGDWEHLPIVEGTDLTEALGVIKYEPAMKFSRGVACGKFPTHILPITDEDRIQSNLFYLKRFEGKRWAATVKLDGSSATFGEDLAEGGFFCASRNLKVRDGDNVYWNIARKYDLSNKLGSGNSEGLIVQGEVCGPGIQKNRLCLKDIDFFVFRIYDQLRKEYVGWETLTMLCKELGLKHVPLDSFGENFDFTLDQLLAKAEGKYDGTQNEREGLVFHLRDHDPKQFGGWTSFKVISNRYLLKGGEEE